MNSCFSLTNSLSTKEQCPNFLLQRRLCRLVDKRRTSCCPCFLVHINGVVFLLRSSTLTTRAKKHLHRWYRNQKHAHSLRNESNDFTETVQTLSSRTAKSKLNINSPQTRLKREN